MISDETNWLRIEPCFDSPPPMWEQIVYDWDKVLSGAQKTMRALKAWNTRWARQDFIRKHGVDAYSVIRLLRRGWGALDVARHLTLPVRAVAAYKAHLTRGSYNTFLEECRI